MYIFSLSDLDESQTMQRKSKRHRAQAMRERIPPYQPSTDQPTEKSGSACYVAKRKRKGCLVHPLICSVVCPENLFFSFRFIIIRRYPVPPILSFIP